MTARMNVPSNEGYAYALLADNMGQFGLQADNDLEFAIKMNESINIIRGGGGKIYYDTKENWDLVPSLVGERGAIYIYSDRSYIEDEVGNRVYVPGIKVGDGSAYLIDAPFVDASVVRALALHISDMEMHITQNERVFWNNKVSSYINQSDAENLVFSKTNYIVEDILNG